MYIPYMYVLLVMPVSTVCYVHAGSGVVGRLIDDPDRVQLIGAWFIN